MAVSGRLGGAIGSAQIRAALENQHIAPIRAFAECLDRQSRLLTVFGQEKAASWGSLALSDLVINLIYWSYL